VVVFLWFLEQIGSFAIPDVIHWAPALPKTRSGKILRRLLRNIAANQFDDFVHILTSVFFFSKRKTLKQPNSELIGFEICTRRTHALHLFIPIGMQTRRRHLSGLLDQVQ
jgi:hypothetical protein